VRTNALEAFWSKVSVALADVGAAFVVKLSADACSVVSANLSCSILINLSTPSRFAVLSVTVMEPSEFFTKNN
jgi:hypothetical protein